MRYLIIDIEKLKATENAISNPREALNFSVGLNKYIKPFVLSEEETLSKFKEVWDAGAIEAQGNYLDAPTFEEFMKTL